MIVILKRKKVVVILVDSLCMNSEVCEVEQWHDLAIEIGQIICSFKYGSDNIQYTVD